MKYRYFLYSAALLLLTILILNIPKFVMADEIYLPTLLSGQEQPESALTLDTNPTLDTNATPTPTATPSEFDVGAPRTIDVTPLPRETIDLAPWLAEEEKVLVVFSNAMGGFTDYLIAPDEVIAQTTKLMETLGRDAFQVITYPQQRYPWLADEEKALPVATADPSFVHPEVQVPPTPKPR